MFEDPNHYNRNYQIIKDVSTFTWEKARTP